MDREVTRCRQNNTELAELIRNSREGQWVDYTGWQGRAVVANAVAFSPANAEQMATAQTNGDIYVWNVNTANLIYSWDTGGASMGKSLSWSRDGTKLLCGTVQGTVKMWDTGTGTDHVFFKENSQRTAIEVAMSPDGNTAAAGLDDGRVMLWDVVQKRLIPTQGHKKAVGGLAFSNQHLVSGSADRTIRFWNVRSGALEEEIRDLAAGVRTIAFSPDGKSFASGLDDNSVRIWNAGTRTQRRDLHGHTSRVNNVAFSPDGRQLASTSDDGSVRIWSLTDDYALATFGQRKAKSVSFSSNGKFLAGIGELTPLRMWQKAPA